MKLNNKGWGFRMMAILMSILVVFLAVAIYLIYNFYDSLPKSNVLSTNYMVVLK